MVDLIRGLTAEGVRSRLKEARERIEAAAARAGRHGSEVELLAAVKYVEASQIPVLAEAGVTVAGENRAQELELKVPAGPSLTWDFIGHLQSRKVRSVLPLVRYIHSVAGESVLEQLGRHGGPGTKVLIEVNVTGEAGKSGIAPAELPAYLERCPVPVLGLMTMPPLSDRPETSRRPFAALRELADRHDLAVLSMGTSQDYEVAVEEGATIVRLGRSLYT